MSQYKAAWEAAMRNNRDLAKERDEAQQALAAEEAKAVNMLRRARVAEQALAAAQARAKAAEAENAELVQARRELRDSHDDAAKQWGERIKQTESTNAELRGEVERVHANYNTATARYHEYRERALERADRLARVVEVLERAKADLAGEKKLRIELDRQLDEMTAQADGLRAELAEANAECDELKAIGEARGNHINARQAELAESQQQTLDALEQRDAANERAKRSRAQYAGKLARRDATIARLHDAIEGLNVRVERAEDELDRITDSVDSALGLKAGGVGRSRAEEIRRITARAEAANARAERAEDERDDLEANITDDEEDLRQLRDELQGAIGLPSADDDTLVKAVCGLVLARQSAINELQSRDSLDGWPGIVEGALCHLLDTNLPPGIDAQLLAARIEMAELNAVIDGRTALVGTLTRQADAAEAENAELRGEVERWKQSSNHASDEAADFGAEIAGLTTRLARVVEVLEGSPLVCEIEPGKHAGSWTIIKALAAARGEG
jgi:chromosome segregation ATPase